MQEVREDFLEEVTLVLRPGGSQGVLGKWEGIASAKALEQEQAWCVGRTQWRPV